MHFVDHPVVRLLVIDDHDLFRRGLIASLARDSRLSVVGNAADAGQALHKAEQLQPDVILLDIHMPGVSGIDALPSLLVVAPRAHIMMLTISEDESDLRAALNGGACGYLLKTMQCDDLNAAVYRAFKGETVIAPEMIAKWTTSFKGNSLKADLTGRS